MYEERNAGRWDDVIGRLSDTFASGVTGPIPQLIQYDFVGGGFGPREISRDAMKKFAMGAKRGPRDPADAKSARKTAGERADRPRRVTARRIVEEDDDGWGRAAGRGSE